MLKIKELRKARGYSQEGLARIAGMQSSRLSTIEKNKTNPTAVTLLKLARALKVQPGELFLPIDFDEAQP